MCWSHGGAAPQVRAAALARVQRRMIVGFLEREAARQRAVEARRVAAVADALDIDQEQAGSSWAFAAALVVRPDLAEQ